VGGAVSALVAMLGLAAGALVVLALCAATGSALPAPAQRPAGPGLAERLAAANVTAGKVGAAVVAGTAAALLTGWPVAGLLTVAGWFALPRMVAGGAAPADLARVEAIATWSEMLRDTLAAAGGLQQSIVATAPIAPPAIRAELVDLADRLRREPLTSGLRRLAEDLEDPTADLVVSALLLASERSPRQLAPLLGTLAAQARAEVASRLRVEAGRARTRSSVRIITLITIGFAFGLVLLNPAYVEAYGDASGQLVLLLIGALFAGGLAWIGRASRADRPARLLDAGGSAA
jgi:Flp pilus assembly protein TadB